MKLTLTHYGVTVSVETDGDDLSLIDVIDTLVRPVLTGAGFDSDLVYAAIPECLED